MSQRGAGGRFGKLNESLYEADQHLFPTPPPGPKHTTVTTAPPKADETPDPTFNEIWLIVGMVGAGALFTIGIIIGLALYCHRKRGHNHNDGNDVPAAGESNDQMNVNSSHETETTV